MNAPLMRGRRGGSWGSLGWALLLVVGAVLATATAALALWTVTVFFAPVNYALANAASLSAPTAPTATANGGGAITIGWTLPASQLSGAKYRVTRTSGPGSPSPVCSVASSVNSCQDTDLTPATTYGYSIAAILDSWQSAPITASATTASPTLAIALSPGPYTAGTPITVVTITAMNGPQVDTTYSGLKTISWSGLGNSLSGQAPAYPGSAVLFTSGVAAPASTFTAFAAGSNTLTATDSHASTVTGSATFTLSPTLAGQLAFTSVTPGPGTAGSAIPDVAVSVEDSYGNVETSLNSGSVTMSIKSGSPQASFTSGTTTVAVASGVASFTNLVVDTAGSYTLTATPNLIVGVTTAVNSNAFTVSPASASTLTVSSGTSQTAGTSFNVTVTARDAYGNQATGYAGTAHFSLGVADSGASGLGNYIFTTGVGKDNGQHVFAVTLIKATGGQSITATDTVTSTITGVQAGITVSAAGASTLTVSSGTSQTAGTSFNVTVTAKDTYGNQATGYTGTVHFSLGVADSGASGLGNYAFTTGAGKDNGQHVFAVTLTKATGGQSITATDTVTSTITGSQTGITVSAAGASTLTVSSGTSQTAGTSFNVTVTAKDAYGNQATGYTGTVQFSLGVADGSASGLGNYAFTTGAGKDNGQHVFAVTLTKATGGQSITATDTVTSTITGSQTGITVASGAPAKLMWTSLSVHGGTLSATSGFSVSWSGANNQTVTGLVSVTDSSGNVIQNIGSGHVITLAGVRKTPSPLTLTISATGAATSTATFSYKADNGSWTTDTLTASDTTDGYSPATVNITH